MTERQLKRLYVTYNRKYFDNKLPAEVPIQLIDMSQTDNAGLCLTYQEPGLTIRTLHIDKGMRESEQKLTLLHELCHLKLGGDPKHDKDFDEEMLRIAHRGAFHELW